MISLQRSMHSSQMYTPGPAMSFFTCFCDFPQKLHFSSSSWNLAKCVPPVRSGWSSVLLPVAAGRLDHLGELACGDHFVDHAVFLGGFGRHDEVAVAVLLDLFDRLAGVERQDLVELLAQAQYLAGPYLDVGRLATRLTSWLVDEHARVRQRESLAAGAGRKDHRCGRGGHAHHGGRYIIADVLHRVVDREQRVDVAARRVD